MRTKALTLTIAMALIIGSTALHAIAQKLAWDLLKGLVVSVAQDLLIDYFREDVTEQEIATLKSTVRDLQHQLRSFDTPGSRPEDYEVIQTMLSRIDTLVNSIEGRVVSLEETVGNLERRVSVLEKDIPYIRSFIADYKASPLSIPPSSERTLETLEAPSAPVSEYEERPETRRVEYEERPETHREPVSGDEERRKTPREPVPEYKKRAEKPRNPAPEYGSFIGRSLPQVWEGYFSQPGYGGYPMILSIEKVRGSIVVGKLNWPRANNAVTAIEGQIVTRFDGFAEFSKWRAVKKKVKGTEGIWLRFTEDRLLAGKHGSVVLHGQYYCHVTDEGVMKGVWFNKGSIIPYGEYTITLSYK